MQEGPADTAGDTEGGTRNPSGDWVKHAGYCNHLNTGGKTMTTIAAQAEYTGT